MNDPESVAKFKSMISSIPPVPWETDAHDHLVYLSTHVRLAMRACFPIRVDQPSKGYIYNATWGWILQRKYERLSLKSWHGGRRAMLPRQCIDAWRYGNDSHAIDCSVKYARMCVDAAIVSHRIQSVSCLIGRLLSKIKLNTFRG